MLFRQLFDNTSFTYTYLLADSASREALLIDPVYERHARDSALLRELNLNLLLTIDTHVHADHVTGAWLMKQAFGSRIGLSQRYGASNVDEPLDHGRVVRIGSSLLEVRATPGHTVGCITLVTSGLGMAFTGDALLIRGAGRTDFQGGDARTLYRSIEEQILTLPDDCLIYPAHDYQGRTASTAGEERTFNPRIGGGANEHDFVGYMDNLGLPHPKQIDAAVPGNMRCGEPQDGRYPTVASWGPVTVTYGGISQIDPEWVAQNRARIHLLDVRTDREIDEELPALDGSQIIPLDELRSRFSEVPKDRPVVTVCRSGKRSGLATVILKEAGIADAANLAGGIIRWRQLSLPVS
jgi:glyoxylase-like metal-dependent hydrolase (beta-lactamase superfamily II)/rhodanese-related sulfurtransferase